MPKEQYREADVIKKISHVSFSIDSAQSIQQTSHIQVKQRHLYDTNDQNRTPLEVNNVNFCEIINTHQNLFVEWRPRSSHGRQPEGNTL